MGHGGGHGGMAARVSTPLPPRSGSPPTSSAPPSRTARPSPRSRESKGVDVQTVIDAMVAQAKTHLDEEVASGEHTQDEADTSSADVTERITDMVNNGMPARPDHPGRPGDDSDTETS